MLNIVTLSIKTLCMMRFSIMVLNIMTFHVLTLSIIIISIMTLSKTITSIMTLSTTLQNVLLSVTAEPAMLSIVILGVDILGAARPIQILNKKSFCVNFGLVMVWFIL
jgi:hypothetical protein